MKHTRLRPSLLCLGQSDGDDSSQWCESVQHLAVVIGGVDAGSEDVQQRVDQTLTAAQLTPRLLPS